VTNEQHLIESCVPILIIFDAAAAQILPGRARTHGVPFIAAGENEGKGE